MPSAQATLRFDQRVAIVTGAGDALGAFAQRTA